MSLLRELAKAQNHTVLSCRRQQESADCGRSRNSPKQKILITEGKKKKKIRLNLFRNWILVFMLVQMLLRSTDKAEIKITVRP